MRMPGGHVTAVPAESLVSTRIRGVLRAPTTGGGSLARAECYRRLSRRCANAESPATGVAVRSHPGSSASEAQPEGVRPGRRSRDIVLGTLSWAPVAPPAHAARPLQPLIKADARTFVRQIRSTRLYLGVSTDGNFERYDQAVG